MGIGLYCNQGHLTFRPIRYMELYSRQAFTTSQDEATKFGAWMSLWMLKKWRRETYKFTAQQQKSSASPKSAVNMLQSIYLLWLTHQHVDYNMLVCDKQKKCSKKKNHASAGSPFILLTTKKTKVAWPVSCINHPVLCSKACSLWGVSIGMRDKHHVKSVVCRESAER